MHIPRPIALTFAVISGALSIVGLSTIVDGIVGWTAFFRDVIDLYIYFVRDTVAFVIEPIWPDIFPPIPDIVFDIGIVWSTSFAVFRIFTMLEKESVFLIRPIRRRFVPLIVGLCGPFGPFLLLVAGNSAMRHEKAWAQRDQEAGEREMNLSTEGWIAIRKRMEAAAAVQEAINKTVSSLTMYYGAALALIVLAALINHQLLLRGL